MAASMVDQTSGQQLANQCESDGNFAVICSFFYKFSESLGITYNIQHLKDMIEDNNHLSEELIELHIKLLRKRRKYINKDKWERALVKFCAEYSNVDSWELERYGYKNSKLSIKLEILKRLLEAQFDYNSKFKLEVNANEAQSLRLAPIGRDVNGHMYWYQLDPDFNFRIYREESDDEQSWLLVCQNKTQLESLIADLETNSTIDSLNKEETSSLSDTNDDNNSNLNNKVVFNDIKAETVDMDVSESVSKDVKVSEDVSKGAKVSDMRTKQLKVSEELSNKSSDEIVSNVMTKHEIKCEPIEDLNKSEEVISDEKSLSLKLEPKSELIDGKCVADGSDGNKCVENGLIEDNVCPKQELSEKPFVSQQINGKINETIDLKSNHLNSSSKLTNSLVTKSDENFKQIEEKSIFKSNNNEMNCFVNNMNNESEDRMKSEFCFNNNNKNNLFDSQLDCDVLHVIEVIVDKVSTNLADSSVQSKPMSAAGPKHLTTGQTGGPVITQMTLLSIEQTVSVLCDFLVDEVCKQSTVKTHTVGPSMARGRGRPPRSRGSSRGRGRGRGSSSVAKVNIYNKRSRSVSMDGSEDKEQDVIEEQPQKRCSRRIQALQERKAQEMSEKVKREQQQIEKLAKKRCALIAAKDKAQSDEELSNTSSLKRTKEDVTTAESEGEASDSDASEDIKHKKKRRRKGGKGKNGAKPWENTDESSDSSVESVEEEEEHEEDEDVLKFDDNEDEFACEDPESDAEPVVVRRARTVRKVRSDSSDNNESSSESEVENDDKPCGRCGKYDHPEWILLCDKCDDGFHTACLRPPLMLIPDGDWYCPPCEHKMLTEKLHEELSTLSVQLAKKEREELRKQRLKYVAISVDNILKKPTTTGRRKGKTNGNELNDDLMESEDKDDDNECNDENDGKKVVNKDNEDVSDEEDSDSSEADDEIGKALWSEDDEEEDKYAAIKSRRNRNRKNINYKFSEYDQLIKSAIEMEMDVEYEEPALEPGVEPKSKGKDMSNIIANTGEELDFSLTPVINTVDSNCDQNIAETNVQNISETVIQNEDKSKEVVPEVKISSDVKVSDKPNEDKEEDDNEEEDSDEEEEEESDESETKSQSKSGGKKRSAKEKASARKRHRGLNDLSDTEEEDDSDEDFKGDSSATEVDEGSDEEFVDDGSTQEEDEVSDGSAYNYRRRRSTRASSKSKKKSKSSRSKGSKSGGKKGYRRDAFVVSSDDSGDSYRPSRSRGGRAAARKKVSYREETTTEDESEDQYYKPATNKKSSNRWKSGSSDEDWGQRKDTKNDKQKKLWSDDEEDEEEEDNEDNDEENDSNDDEEEEEVPKSGDKPGPKSSKSGATQPVIKGKSRVSKAKGLVNDDSEDQESQPNVQKSTKTNKKSNVLSDSDGEKLVTNKIGDKSVAADSVTINTNISVNKTNDKNFEISEQLSVGTVKTVGANSEPTLNQQKPDNQLSVDSSKVHPIVGPPKELLLSAPVCLPVPHLIPQTNCYPQTSDKVIVSTNNIDEYYSLTPLDTYPVSRPPPLKPTVVNDPYLQASSPPRILTLESNSPYVRHPMEYTTVAHPMQAPKALMDPRMERPYLSHNIPPNVGPMGPFAGHPPPLRNDLRPTHTRPQAPPHGFGSPYYGPVPAPGGHPYYPRGPLPRHETPPPFPTTHHRPQTNSPIGSVPRTTVPSTTAPAMAGQPPPPNYRSAPGPHWSQTQVNRTPIPGYNFGAHSPHPSSAPSYYGPPHGQPLPAHPQSPHVMPLPPTRYPPAPYQNYGYFGPNVGPGAPNGAFMIQNLLQHRPPNPEDSHPMPTVSTPVATTAPTTTGAPPVPTQAANTSSTGSSGQPLRPTNETFSTY